MGSCFHETVAGFVAPLLSAAGESIAYSRGVYSVNVRAMVGKTIFWATDSDGAEIRSESRDYIGIPAADLILNEALVTPQEGDTISEVIPNGNTLVCEVMAPDGEQLFRYMDEGHTLFRIHTKHVSTTIPD